MTQADVVYRTIPTSNHNSVRFRLFVLVLYIVLFLHQTTTVPLRSNIALRCISYFSYIKPQPAGHISVNNVSCISYYSYIKPQQYWSSRDFVVVVYRTIPTSNHNYDKK